MVSEGPGTGGSRVEYKGYMNSFMEMRRTARDSAVPFPRKESSSSSVAEGKKVEYRRSFSQGQGIKIFPISYFSLESFLLLVCLTASLLILPLILPPLPPPPFMLLLLPICILAVLMVLAFMPSNVRDITYTYV